MPDDSTLVPNVVHGVQLVPADKPYTVRVALADLIGVFATNAARAEQVTELQATATAQAEATRERAVRAFHLKFGHPVEWKPTVPDDEQVRFRMSLVAEEFFELLEATFGASVGLAAVENVVRHAIRSAPVTVDLPELADALTDLDYVIEGTRAVYGIWGPPILAEVQRANMAKSPVYVNAKDAHHVTEITKDQAPRPDPKAKPTKPADWKAPDVRALLIAQGWDGKDGRS